MNPDVYMTTLSSDGEITLPKEILSNLGVNIGDNIMFIWDGEQVNLTNPLENKK